MLYNSLDELEETGKMGDWCFINEDTSIVILYGNDHFKDIVILPISPLVSKSPWKWDGNKEHPTLTPSILVYPYEGWTNGWHGYLTGGKLVSV